MADLSQINVGGTTYDIKAKSLEYSTGTADAARNVWFSDTAGIGKLVYDNDFKYNPATNLLSTGSVQLNNKVTQQYNATTQALDFIFS